MASANKLLTVQGARVCSWLSIFMCVASHKEQVPFNQQGEEEGVPLCHAVYHAHSTNAS